MTPSRARPWWVPAAAPVLAVACALWTAATVSGVEPPQPPPGAAKAAGRFDALVAPIALYPDPLIAIILPASTLPDEILAASAYLIQYGDATRIGDQRWDPSVRALAHYPTVVTWLAQNIAWTRALGRAFLSSPSEVMDSVQRLRMRALAAGVLAPTREQQVYSQDGEIEIYPAEPESIYVPQYDDSVVFSDIAYAGPYIDFGSPFPAGGWLTFYLDWGGHRLWSGGHGAWSEHGGWDPPHAGGRGPPGSRPWAPPVPGSVQAPEAGQANAHPRPMPGSPTPPTAVPGLKARPLTSPVASPFISPYPAASIRPAAPPAPAHFSPAPAPPPRSAPPSAPAPAPAAASAGREPQR